MAYGTELVLGWPFSHWDKLTEVKLPKYTVGAKIPRLVSEDESEDREAFYTALAVVNEPLHVAHCNALAELGFSNIRMHGGYILATTPLGERVFSPWKLELFYDPGEMDEIAEDAIIGVPISSRYYTKFADWKNPHGGMFMIFDDELHKLMEIAKRHIVSVLPCLESAPWIVKEIHY